MCQICSFTENFLHVIRIQVIHSFYISSAMHRRRFISIVALLDFFKSSAYSRATSLYSNLSACSCIFSILYKNLEEQK